MGNNWENRRGNYPAQSSETRIEKIRRGICSSEKDGINWQTNHLKPIISPKECVLKENRGIIENGSDDSES